MKARHLAVLIGAALCAAMPALADPYTLHIGRGSAAEEGLWLMEAMPSLTPNQGKLYKIDMTEFRGVDQRFQAYEAGQLDLATASTEYILFAATQGMKFKLVASISEEALPGFVTQYMVKDASPIRTLQDLKGKIIGINAARSSIEFWARGAVKAGGLNPDREIRTAIVPFPAQGEAVRSGTLDVGAFPQPFAAQEWARGGMRTIFTSKTAVPFGDDLMVLVASPALIDGHQEVLRAFLADFVAANRYFIEHNKEAKEALLASGIVKIPHDTFLGMEDNLRDPNARINVETTNRLIGLLYDDHYIATKFDAASVIDTSFLPK